VRAAASARRRRGADVLVSVRQYLHRRVRSLDKLACPHVQEQVRRVGSDNEHYVFARPPQKKAAHIMIGGCQIDCVNGNNQLNLIRERIDYAAGEHDGDGIEI